MTDFSKALVLQPGNPLMLGKRGEAYERLGQRTQALEDFQAALAIAPEFEAAQQGVMRLGNSN